MGWKICPYGNSETKTVHLCQNDGISQTPIPIIAGTLGESHMLIASILVALLVILSTLTHYEVLRLLSASLPRLRILPRARLLVVLFGTFVGHLLEISYYALAYYFLKDHFDLGNFGGNFADTFSSYLYFSAETYTTIGLGDIYPLGPLRLITGIEALNGLLLIGWSASFTYIAMQKFWKINEEN